MPGEQEDIDEDGEGDDDEEPLMPSKQQRELDAAREAAEDAAGALDPRNMAKRAKIDAVWQALNQRDTGGPNAAGPMGPPRSSVPLAALCGRQAAPSKAAKAKPDMVRRQICMQRCMHGGV